MPVFDVSFLNPNAPRGGGSNYNTLIDQLAIKESELASDGKLAPGDYDLLAGMARKIAGSPGLTKDQRSNVLVKIADYGKNKSTSTLKDSQDVQRLGRDYQDDLAKNTMLFGNDPKTLIQTNVDATHAKIQKLADSIDQIEGSGGDASEHLNEYNKTLNEYQDLLHAQNDVNNYKGEGKPDSPYVAYMTTNNSGEIVDVKIGKVGSNSGFTETNGVYGGLQVFGKINSKENGKNVFQIGNTRFSAADLLLPDASNPGAMKSNRLIAEDQQSQGGSGFDTASTNVFKPIDPTKVRVQGAIPTGSWAKGIDGTLYQRLETGRYKKYVNVDEKALGISDSNIIRVPRSLQGSINANTDTTFDGAGIKDFVPQGTMGPLAPGQGYSPVDKAPTPPPQPTGSPKTPSPTSRAPQDSQGLASKITGGVQKFVGSLFGKG